MSAAAKKTLSAYQKKRNFNQTPEPVGNKQSKRSKKYPIFVIHKHDARNLHYDVRLEIDGVLVSWAVPKGPSTNPSVKHLAVPTEDHPMDYATFEGMIPVGNYGAGAVMVWDIGTYKNIKMKNDKLVPMDQCVKDGRVEVWLEGKKLVGGYALIRAQSHDETFWLMLKMNDKHADTRRDILKADTSALTGRTMQEIAGDKKVKRKRVTKKHSLDKKEQRDSIKVGTHEVELSHQDKIYFPPNITKGELVEYYRKIAPAMLPFLKERAVSMQRFPGGIMHEGFFQKEIGDYFPRWVNRVTIFKREGGSNTYAVCNKPESLVYLANQGCITLHLWLSKIDRPNFPDRMIFDLDPGKKSDFTRVRKTALALKDLLEELGLKPFAMTTGSRGMHIVVKLNRKVSFDVVRSFARGVADLLVMRDGGKNLTTEIRLNKRKGRLFIDTNRNAFAQTGVAPYAVRPLPGAPVAAPITWAEVKSPRLTAQSFTIKNVFKHANKDPWKNFTKSACSLVVARKKLDRLITE